MFVDELDRDDEDEEDEDVDEEEEDDDDEFCSLMFGDFELLLLFELFVFVFVRSDVLDESSCFTSRRAARPMLSLVMTRLSMSSEPSAVAIAI